MISLRSAGPRTAIVVLFATVACGSESVTPPPPPPLLSDTAAVAAGIRALDSVFTTPAVRSLSLLGQIMKVAGAAPAQLLLVSAGRCAAGADAPGVTLASPGIPDSLRRRVFALASTNQAYHATTDTSGPADGVRFALYQVDTLGALVLPLVPFGQLDLTEVPWGGTTFKGRLADGAILVADYTVQPQGTQSADTTTMAGTLSLGSHHFAFTDSLVGSRLGLSASTAVSARAVDSADGLTVRTVASFYAYDPFDGNHAIDFTLALGPDTVRLLGNVFTYCLVPSTDVAVTVNGTDFARVINGTSGPTVTPAANVTVTAQQSAIVLALLRTEQRVFKALVAFYTPARQFLAP